MRRHKNEMNEQEEQEEKIIKEKLLKAAEARKPINLFNKHALKLMLKTPSDILCELGVRAFSGSRDVPKDEVKAYGLFDQAAQNALKVPDDKKSQKLYENVQYFHTVIRKYKLNAQLRNDTPDRA